HRAARARGHGGMSGRRGDRDAGRTGRRVVRIVDRHTRAHRPDARRGRRGPRWSGRLTMLRFLTAGESHGPELLVIVEGLPAGLVISEKAGDHDLSRRQRGYGRGARSTKIERDQAEIGGGLALGALPGRPDGIWVA